MSLFGSYRRPSEVAIKHMIERTIGREGVSGLLELIMNNPQVFGIQYFSPHFCH